MIPAGEACMIQTPPPIPQMGDASVSKKLQTALRAFGYRLSALSPCCLREEWCWWCSDAPRCSLPSREDWCAWGEDRNPWDEGFSADLRSDEWCEDLLELVPEEDIESWSFDVGEVGFLRHTKSKFCTK